MHKTTYEILDVFKKNPTKDFSTTDLLNQIDFENFTEIKKTLKDKYTTLSELKIAKRDKARVHRKILYHLSQLTDKNILKVSKEGKNGEKYFGLAIEEGQELVLEGIKKDSLKITKPRTPNIPIAGYEKKGMLHRFEGTTWIERINSILLECSSFEDLQSLNKSINQCFQNINDTLALNEFEVLFNKEQSSLERFLKRLEDHCEDFDKNICCLINLEKIQNKKSFLEFVDYYLSTEMENINFVYNTTPKFFSENNTFFKKLISTYVGCGKYFYIKNDMLHKQPYFIGKVGPYTFGEEEWDIYNAELKGNIDGLVCGQTTMLVDVEKFMEDKKHPEEELTEFLEKIMHSLLTSNSLQRRKTEEYFENIIKLNKSPAKNYFSFSKNYIRFWNYGWKKEDIDQEKMIKMFKKAKKIANKFSLAEETIYKSCGMPTRFRIAFSCCNAEYAENILSKGDYTKFFVDSIKDFYVEKTKEIIQSKEMLFDCFDGGDVITLHRVSNFNPENIIREMLFIFNSYNLPFFRYKFEKNKEGDLKLDSFIK